MTTSETLPVVVVVGAGPVGLAAAAHLWERGLEPLVLEAGDSPAAAVASWGHVRLFSPWRFDVDAAARRLLEPPAGWSRTRTVYRRAPSSWASTWSRWHRRLSVVT
jgi:flavin-dependent dehydrogenase